MFYSNEFNNLSVFGIHVLSVFKCRFLYINKILKLIKCLHEFTMLFCLSECVYEDFL